MAKQTGKRRTTKTTRRRKVPRKAPASASSLYTPGGPEVSTAPVEELRSSIQTVAQEIGRVRDRARGEVESLDRLRSALSLAPLNELMTVLDSLEERIGQLEAQIVASSQGAEHWKGELAKEQERLRKLWDGYVAQEDEFNAVKAELSRASERLAEREATLANYERELGGLQSVPDLRNRLVESEKQSAELHRQLADFQKQLQAKERDLAAAHTELAGYARTKEERRAADVVKKELDAERERLAKLYKVYEESESKMRAAMSELNEWRGWFTNNREYFEAVGKAAEIKART